MYIFILIQFFKKILRSFYVLVIRMQIVFVLVLMNDGVIIFVLVFILAHDFITVVLSPISL